MAALGRSVDFRTQRHPRCPSTAAAEVTLRARALRREASQSVAALERGEEHSGQGHGVLEPRTKALSSAQHQAWHPLETAKSVRVMAIFSFEASKARHNTVLVPKRVSGRSLSPIRVRCTSNRKLLKLSGRASERPARFHQALANQSLNRTVCSAGQLGFI